MKNLAFIFLVLAFSGILSCSQDSKDDAKKMPWVGSWIMTGYDQVKVENRDTLVLMNLTEDGKIEYITQTRKGEILMQNKGSYKLNDQQSMITVEEDGMSKTEYFIRKVDKDSFIFQSDTLTIRWKRID